MLLNQPPVAHVVAHVAPVAHSVARVVSMQQVSDHFDDLTVARLQNATYRVG